MNGPCTMTREGCVQACYTLDLDTSTDYGRAVAAVTWGLRSAGYSTTVEDVDRWLGYAMDAKRSRWLAKCRVPAAAERAWPDRPYPGRAGDALYREMCLVRYWLNFSGLMRDAPYARMGSIGSAMNAFTYHPDRRIREVKAFSVILRHLIPGRIDRFTEYLMGGDAQSRWDALLGRS